MQGSLESSPNMFVSDYGEFNHENNHIESMKRSSNNVTKYIETTSMLYSPNMRFIDQTMKNNFNTIKTTNEEEQNWKAGENHHHHSQDINNTDERKSDKRITIHNDNSPSLGSNLGKVVSKLQTRLDGVQVKIASLTNVIKLLQKYSQTKDDQYQKQKQNLFYSKNTAQRINQIDSIELENRIKEFHALSKQMKRELEEVTLLRQHFQQSIPKTIKHYQQYQLAQIKRPSAINVNTRSKKSQSKSPTSQGSYLDVEDLATAFQEMEQRLRDQINKKMDICLRQIKKISFVNEAQTITGIDQNLFEEQINSLNFNINKLENQFNRNKMIVENQFEDIINRIPIYHSPSLDYMSRKYANEPDPIKIKAVRDRSADKSTYRSRSRKKSQQRSFSRQQRDKSKSNLKSNNQSEKLLDKKKLKEEQVQEAIRRKKEIKEKLKNSHHIKSFS